MRTAGACLLLVATLALTVGCSSGSSDSRPARTATPPPELSADETIAAVKAHVIALDAPQRRLLALQDRLKRGVTLDSRSVWDGRNARWSVSIGQWRFHYYEKTRTVDYLGLQAATASRGPTPTPRPPATPRPTATPFPTATPRPTATPTPRFRTTTYVDPEKRWQMRVPVAWGPPAIVFSTEQAWEHFGFSNQSLTSPLFMGVSRQRSEGAAPDLDGWTEETIAGMLETELIFFPESPKSFSEVAPVLVSGLRGREFIHADSLSFPLGPPSTTIEVLLVSGLDSYKISATAPNDEWPSLESTFRELVYSFRILE